jgi:hypothetical protein
MLNGMEFSECNLENATLAGSAIGELSLHKTSIKGTNFADALPESVQFDYAARVFGSVAVSRALQSRGAAGLRRPQAEIIDLERDWRKDVTELLVSRLRRFYIPGPGGAPEGSRWDPSISERNLFGGLKPSFRHFTGSELVPEMLKQGILTRHREHNTVVYRLEADARDSARRLLEQGAVEASIKDVIDRLAPISA